MLVQILHCIILLLQRAGLGLHLLLLLWGGTRLLSGVTLSGLTVPPSRSTPLAGNLPAEISMEELFQYRSLLHHGDETVKSTAES